MSKPTGQKPARNPNQPKLTELSPEQLEKVTGGQKIKLTDITITKTIDKSSP